MINYFFISAKSKKESDFVVRTNQSYHFFDVSPLIGIPQKNMQNLRSSIERLLQIKFEVTKLSLDASLTEKAANVVRQNIQDKVVAVSLLIFIKVCAVM